MIQVFQEKIWEFYNKNKREFPWRKTTNPYQILISEVMLQQTQTSRVISKYEEFLKKFPTLESLANASNTEVLRVWSGLGYNRRGLYLKKTAEILTSHHTGSDIEATHGKGNDWLNPKFLKTLPGIGPNTADSIYVFTTNKPHVFIETNIRRVFIYEFFKNQKVVSDKEILKLVKKSLPAGRQAREWYYALMDYGAFLGKTKVNPNRKSKQYAKQSKFEGSFRQTRGKILKILLNENPITITSLQEKIASDHFRKALQALENEGFVRILKNNQIQIC